jgi:hypothetical protein
MKIRCEAITPLLSTRARHIAHMDIRCQATISTCDPTAKVESAASVANAVILSSNCFNTIRRERKRAARPLRKTVEVTVGQRWVARDPRQEGRIIEVIQVGDVQARCVVVAAPHNQRTVGRPTWIRLDMFGQRYDFFDEENTRVDRQGHRHCRTCERDREVARSAA